MMPAARLIPLACALTLAVLPAVASAQVTPPPVREYAAQSLARVTLLDLRMQPDPDQRDYRIAQLGLSMARSITPDDQELLRREIEAAWSAGRDADALTLSRELLSLDPADEVALLRVIANGVERMQTVEDRMAAYERLLGEGGASLPAPVRSRLALDAALLAREAGDTSRFVDLLTTATSLDQTNKPAATLALQYYNQRDGEPIGRLELLINLLLADPVDPAVHETISNELASHGAFAQALRFSDMARQLRQRQGRLRPTEATLRRYTLLWLANGPDGLATEMELPILQERARLEQTLRLMAQRGEPLEGLQRPTDIVPPPNAAALRMLVAAAAGSADNASRASEDLRTSTSQRLRQLLLNARTRDEARRVALLATRIRAENGIAMVVAGVQPELVRADIRQANESLDNALAEEGPLAGVDPAEIDAARAQLALVNKLLAATDAAGTPDADARLEALADDVGTVPLATLALTHARLAAGRTAQALPQLRALASGDPISQWGAWAVQRLRDLGVSLPFTDTQAAAAVAQAVPEWLDRMTEGPERYMALDIDATQTSMHCTGFTRVRLRVRNTSPIPLGVGPSAPINSQIMLSPVLEADLDSLTPLAVPEIASLDRRLRLMPRQSFEAEFWVGGGLTGWFLEACGTRTTRTRWRAIQGFRLVEGKGYQPGPMGLAAESNLVLRRPLPEMRLDANGLATRMLADDEAVLTTIAAALKATVAGPDSGRLRRPPEFYQPIVAAAAQRLSQVSPLTRVAMMAAMPNARMSEAMAAFDAAALEQDAPLPVTAALLTRADDPEHPIFERAAASGDARLAELARLLADRLRDGAASYAAFEGFGPAQRRREAAASATQP